jgi:hypothetical protein
MTPLAIASEAWLDWDQDGPDGPHGAAAWFCFDAELTVLTGHFPGQPILPGVIAIGALVVCARRWPCFFGSDRADVQELRRVSWRQPCPLGQPVLASIHAGTETGWISGELRTEAGAAPLLKARLRLG